MCVCVCVCVCMCVCVVCVLCVLCVCCVPPFNQHWRPECSDILESLLARPDVVAVGETGLDLNRMLSTLPEQKEAFHAQVQWVWLTTGGGAYCYRVLVLKVEPTKRVWLTRGVGPTWGGGGGGG